MSDSSSSTGRISFFTILAIVFITLKLAEYGPVADWSWWWVLAPLWLPTVLVLGIILITFIGALALTSFTK